MAIFWKWSPRQLILYLAWATGLGHHCATAYADDLRSIFASQRELLSRIQTLDVQYSIEHQYSNGGPPKKTATHFQLKGSRYRVEYPLEGSFGQRPNSIAEVAAFNLDRYQTLDKHNLILLLQKSPPPTGYGTNHPFLEPYSALFRSAPMRTFDNLRDRKDGWTEAEALSKVVAPSTFGGFDCVVVETRYPSNGAFARTYFAKDREFSPVGFAIYGFQGQLAMEYVVKELQTLTTDVGSVHVPMHAVEEWYRDGKVYSTYVFKVSTDHLEINQPISDDVFTISPALARGIEDVDNPANTYHPHLEMNKLYAQASQKMEQFSPTDSGRTPDNTSAQVPLVGDATQRMPLAQRKLPFYWQFVGAIMLALGLIVLWRWHLSRVRG